MIATPRRTLVAFGTFEVDLDGGEIRKAGMRVRLAGQPFRVLAALLNRPGDIVSREELQREIWGANTNVDFERGIASAVNKIREALGDSADHPIYIETLARRGYRFIAPVAVPAEAPVAPPAAPAPAPISQPPSLLPAAETPSTPSSVLAAPAASPLSAPRAHRSSAISSAAYALLGLAILLSGFAIWMAATHLRRPQEILRPPAINQLTDDNSIYAGPPNPETMLMFATDGPRIYAPVLNQGHSHISSLDLNGTEIQRVTMPEDLSSVAITDISHDGARLLVRSVSNREPEQALWVLPTAGSGALRVGEVMAHDAVFLPNSTDGVLYATGNELGVVQLGTGAVTPFASLPGRAFWLRWAPDGKTLRFTLLDPLTHTTSLWELDALSRNPHRLNLPELQNRSVCCGSWTPAGDLFVFQVSDAGSSNVWAQTTGPHPTLLQLTNGPLRFSSPLPDREKHSVYAFGGTSPALIRMYDPAQRRFTPAARFLSEAQRVSYSRDGAWVAWTDTDGRLWRARSSDGSGLLRLCGDDLEVYLAHWSPNGKQLLLMARRPGETWQIYTVSAAGGAVHSLFSDHQNVADPDWAPDGRHVVFGREADLMGEENGPHDLRILDVQTQQVEQVPGSKDLFSPRWSPDGRYLAALSRDQARLLLFDFKTRSWKTLYSNGAADPVWSSDSRSLFFHAFAQPDSPILKITLEGSTAPVAGLSAVGLPSADNFFFSGVTPNGLPLIKPRVGTGNLYSIALPSLK